MPFLRGLILRVGLGALPLMVVILLCCLMMGWPGRNKGQTAIPMPHTATAQAAEVPPGERYTMNGTTPSDAETPMADFQRLHITHARVVVPN